MAWPEDCPECFGSLVGCESCCGTGINHPTEEIPPSATLVIDSAPNLLQVVSNWLKAKFKGDK